LSNIIIKFVYCVNIIIIVIIKFVFNFKIVYHCLPFVYNVTNMYELEYEFRDVFVQEVSDLPDPCPLPQQDGGGGAAAAAGGGGSRRRTLKEQERLLHAPMSDVGGLLFDKDAVYVDIPDWKVRGFGGWLGV
jgi:hypothetical protein